MEIVLIAVLIFAVGILGMRIRSSEAYYDRRLQAIQHDIETIAATRKSYVRVPAKFQWSPQKEEED